MHKSPEDNSLSNPSSPENDEKYQRDPKLEAAFEMMQDITSRQEQKLATTTSAMEKKITPQRIQDTKEMTNILTAIERAVQRPGNVKNWREHLDTLETDDKWWGKQMNKAEEKGEVAVDKIIYQQQIVTQFSRMLKPDSLEQHMKQKKKLADQVNKQSKSEVKPEKGEYYVGVNKNEDGSVDYSKAMKAGGEVARKLDNERVDVEFASASRSWFSDRKEEVFSFAKKEEEVANTSTQIEMEDFAIYHDKLADEVALLGQPKELDLKTKQDLTAEKFGRNEARSMYVAEGMAVLAERMSKLSEFQKEYDDPSNASLKYASLKKDILLRIKQAQAAKDLFMTASEKLFTPSDIQDPKQEAKDITKTYKEVKLWSNDDMMRELEKDFEDLPKSTENPNDFKYDLENTSKQLGDRLGKEVQYLVGDPNRISSKRRDRKHLVMVAGNKLLYRLEKTKEKLGV